MGVHWPIDWTALLEIQYGHFEIVAAFTVMGIGQKCEPATLVVILLLSIFHVFGHDCNQTCNCCGFSLEKVDLLPFWVPQNS